MFYSIRFLIPFLAGGALLYTCATRPSASSGEESYWEGPEPLRAEYRTARPLNIFEEAAWNREGTLEGDDFVVYDVISRDLSGFPGAEELVLLGYRDPAEGRPALMILLRGWDGRGVFRQNQVILNWRDLNRSSLLLQSLESFDFVLMDFDGDGRDDLFLSVGSQRTERRYYLIYTFRDGSITPLLRPWDSFTMEEQDGETARRYAPFLAELRAELFPGFLAEIEVEPNRIFKLDLSSWRGQLIREGVYSGGGLILEKKGIPHLDFYPFLYPVWREGRTELRAVQRVRNRYGLLGVVISYWSFKPAGWVSDQIEFVTVYH